MSKLRWLLLPLAIYAGLLVLAWTSTLPSVEAALRQTVADLGPDASASLSRRVPAARAALAGRALPGIPEFPWGARFLAVQLGVAGLLALRTAQGWLAAERTAAGLLWGATGLILVILGVQAGSDLLENILALQGAVGGLMSGLKAVGALLLLAFLVFAIATTRSWAVRICLSLAAVVVLDASLFQASGLEGTWALLSPSFRLGSLVLDLAFDLQHDADLRGHAWLLLDGLLIREAQVVQLMYANLAACLLALGAWFQAEEMVATSRKQRI